MTLLRTRDELCVPQKLKYLEVLYPGTNPVGQIYTSRRVNVVKHVTDSLCTPRGEDSQNRAHCRKI